MWKKELEGRRSPPGFGCGTYLLVYLLILLVGLSLRRPRLPRLRVEIALAVDEGRRCAHLVLRVSDGSDLVT